MTDREENRINQFLSDTDFNSDSSFFTDDTDNDPTFLPGGHRNTNPSSSPSSSLDNLYTPGLLMYYFIIYHINLDINKVLM